MEWFESRVRGVCVVPACYLRNARISKKALRKSYLLFRPLA